MSKKEFIYVSILIMNSLCGWFIFLSIFTEAIIHPNVYILEWNLYNRANVYYVFIISLINFSSTVLILIHFIRWGDIEKELKEEMRYYNVKTLHQLKIIKKVD